jgi:hypothetical protein
VILPKITGLFSRVDLETKDRQERDSGAGKDD